MSSSARSWSRERVRGGPAPRVRAGRRRGVESVTFFRDGEFPVLRGGSWATRMYTGERSGRCCFVMTVFPWQDPNNRATFYYAGPGNEDRLRRQLDVWVEKCPPLLAEHVRQSLAGLIESVGQRVVEDALSEAVVASVMSG